MNATVEVYNKENYNKYLQRFINSGREFEVHKTGYTAIFKLGKKRVLLNDTGEQRNSELHLINKTRGDAKSYLEGNEIPELDSSSILWYYYNDFNGVDKESGTALKIDINSAYWSQAQKMGVVSQDTINKFKELSKGMTAKEAKSLRLKALGSLATKKVILKYKKGQIVESLYKPYNDKLRYLYLYICSEVANVMTEISSSIGFYHYWDMVILNNPEELSKAKKILENHGFEFTIKSTLYDIIKAAHSMYIYTSDGIMYPVNERDLIFEQGFRELAYSGQKQKI